jgi:UMF1 family MFS transporter
LAATTNAVDAPAPGYSVKEQRSWYVYDWANSVFSTTVVTLFFGPYITSIARHAADSEGLVHPFGIPVDHRSYYGYLVSLSVLMQVFFLPVLGALADYSHRKKSILGWLAGIGSGATVLMFYISGSNYLYGGALFLIANLSFGASIVIYNSFLPDIAPEADRDTVSSKGFAWGYAGGALLLALNLALYSFPEKFGVDGEMAVRISLASAGLWWGLFTLIPLKILRNRGSRRTAPPGETILSTGFKQLFKTLAEMRKYPQTLTFLIAYLIYNDAIQTVIAMSSQFGADELKISLRDLTLAILMVQVVAFPGAIMFNWLARAIKAKWAIAFSLLIWTLIVIAMYGWVKTTSGFFIAAFVVALIMGGSQALSRSLYSLMIPKGREAEYYSLYEISDKGTSWMCPLIFGLALQYTKSYRLAILSLIFFFALGLVVLLKVNVRKAAIEAGNEPV